MKIRGAVLAVFFSFSAVAPGYAWETKRIDYETHNISSDVVEGIYNDFGDWRSWQFGISSNGYYRYLSVEMSPLRQGMAFWYVEIPQTGFYQLKTSYLATKNRTNDADYAVYVNATETDVRNDSAVPVFKQSVNQEAVSADAIETRWVDMGVYCLKKGEVSMIVLDGRDDDQSDSADASDWTYIGGSYGAQQCVETTQTPSTRSNMGPINYLLLRKKS